MPNLPPSCFIASAAIILAFASCKGKRFSEELPASETYQAAEQNRSAEQRPTPPDTLPPAPGAPGERPRVAQHMGRGFQGPLVLRVRTPDGGSDDLRYLSLGNTARLQLDRAASSERRTPARHLDALIWGESVSLLDHQQRTLRTFPLRQIRPRPEPAVDVEIESTGERRSLQGVFCERTLIQQGPLNIDACVSALPGTFDVDKLEAVSGLDVPAWVEALVKDQLLPLEARVTEGQGRLRYALELMQYAPGPIDPELIEVPDNYRRVAEPRVTSRR